MKTVTYKQVFDAAGNHSFIALVHGDKTVTAINCKAFIKSADMTRFDERLDIVRFYPCSFEQFLALKKTTNP